MNYTADWHCSYSKKRECETGDQVWTLDEVESLDSNLHILAQVYHKGLGVKVEINCLRDSDLIPRHSFLSTTFSIFFNGVLKLMCVCVFSGVIKPISALNCLNANRVSQF